MGLLTDSEITAVQWWAVESPNSDKEGLVGYFRHPDVPGTLVCGKCANTMHVHGFIDEGRGYVVCPGDWVLTLPDGAHRPATIEMNGEQF